MKPVTIYFVDEKPEDRVTNVRFLQRLLGPAPVKVVALEPLKSFSDYDPLLTDPSTGAFILDQKMKGGGVAYNGIDLAEHLRSIRPKLPIYILTGAAGAREDCAGVEYRVEEIIDKEDIEDLSSEKAQTIKARMLRRLDVFEDVLGNREQRFHDLLIKSTRGTLPLDEEKELRQLEGERSASVAAAEREKQIKLDAEIETLKKLLGRERLL